MKKFWEDFKKFASKGNIIDMAVGVVIGSAFGKIVSSFVADVITPLISLLTGSVNLTDLKLVLRHAVFAEVPHVLFAAYYVGARVFGVGPVFLDGGSQP